MAAALRYAPATRDADAEVVEVPVCYGGDHGPDLDNVCERLGISSEAFIEMHTASEYSVDMLGFTPGFAFIGGFDEARVWCLLSDGDCQEGQTWEAATAAVFLQAGADIVVIRGTTVSAEHVSEGEEPLNLKQFIHELDAPVIVGGCVSKRCWRSPRLPMTVITSLQRCWHGS